MSQPQINEIKILQKVISGLFEMYSIPNLTRADKQALDERITARQKDLARVIKQ